MNLSFEKRKEIIGNLYGLIMKATGNQGKDVHVVTEALILNTALDFLQVDEEKQKEIIGIIAHNVNILNEEIEKEIKARIEAEIMKPAENNIVVFPGNSLPGRKN